MSEDNNKIGNYKIKALDGLVTVIIQIFSANLLAFKDIDWKMSLVVMFLFAFMVMGEILKALSVSKDDKIRLKKNIFYAVIYGMCLIASVILGATNDMAWWVFYLFSITLFAGRVFSIMKKRKKSRVTGNVIIILLLLITLLVFINPDPKDSILLLYVLAILTLIRSMGHATVLAFSQMKINVIKRIIRKTYAAEILMGLVMLIMSFSVVLENIESSIESYGDALWYCFAIVTTIGFGDFTATTGVGRILSVILGIYGIIVVALITSIIVNFYNETRNDKDDEDNEAEEEVKKENAEETVSENEEKN